jgi:hypothetical protein
VKRAALLIVLLSSASAHAEEQVGSAWIGAELSVLPKGTFTSDFLNVRLDSDVTTAYGVGFFVEDRVTPLITVGFSPRMLVNVAPSNSDRETGQQLDLRVKIEAGHEVIPRLRAYGVVTPGYSIGFPPSDSLITKSHPTGFIIGVGGGLGLALGQRSELTVELGYTWGFQGGTQDNVDYTLKDSYLHIAFGIAGTVH